MDSIVHVVGARPNFMKVAPVMEALELRSRQLGKTLNQLLIHTGQHYSHQMSDLFFRELGLPKPDVNLEIGSGPHGQQTGRIMEAFEKELMLRKPDAVLVVGDVNSTIACALDAKKLNIKVIHVEAGLRSGDLEMPEEINRILTDSISDTLFTTEALAEENLRREGVAAEKIHFVGNVMIDSLLKHREKALGLPTLSGLGVEAGEYVLVTMHRPSNVDDPEILAEIAKALLGISKFCKVLFPIHPRTQSNLENQNLIQQLEEMDNVVFTEPLGYLDFLNCTANAAAVLTDSGGIQEETTILGVPCLTMRDNTERPITITNGTNQLIRADAELVIQQVQLAIGRKNTGQNKIPELWDGSASKRIAEVLLP